jgi:diguanylate cyclase (GGDEF)-like protein
MPKTSLEWGIGSNRSNLNTVGVMRSFKAKLVVYFVLLSLLPITAAFWGFSTVASHSETRRVDARLQAGLRAGLAAYGNRLDAAQTSAERLAGNPSFQRLLEHADRAGIRRMLRAYPHVEVVNVLGFHVGPTPPILSAKRQADVVTSRGLAGSVIAFVPFDTDLTKRLKGSSGLLDDDALVILNGSRILASAPPVYGFVKARPGVAGTASVGGIRYRVLEAGSLDEFSAIRLGVLSPQHAIDAATNATRTRLLLFLLIVLVAVAVVAYLEGRAIVRTLGRFADAAHAIARGRLDQRVPAEGRDEFSDLGRAFNEMADQLSERLDELKSERERLRGAFARFGDALAATHDAHQLIRIVLDTALHATGAKGASFVDDRGNLVHVGDIESGKDRIELPLAAGGVSFGMLTLVGDEFSEDARMTASSLTAQAVIALDNARLHRIVERQALVDGLTGLANRRHCEEALTFELARAQRFGTPLTLVLADLDDFKDVNDMHGHPTGDLVLREFAIVLRETTREADVAARWGGEEFVLLLPGTDEAGGAQLAERVRSSLEQRVILASDGTPVTVTCSLGVASFPAAASSQTLLAAADDALYQAKHAGKNRVETASAVLREP